MTSTCALALRRIAKEGRCSWYEFAGKIFESLGLRPDFGPTTITAFGAKARRPGSGAQR